MAEVTIIEFDIEYGDNVKQTELLTNSLLDLRQELDKNKKSQKDLKKAGDGNIEGLRNLQKEELKLKDKLTEVNRERKKAVDITKIQANTLEGLRKQTSALFKEREKINTSTKTGSKRFAELTAKIKQNTTQIRKADQASGSYVTSIGKYPKAFGAATAKMFAMAGGLALLFRGLKNAINTVKDFEKAIDKLQAITKASDDEINLLREDAKRLGSTTSKTASQVAELQTEFAKLGFSTKEIRDVTEATIELSIAAGSDLSQAAIVAGATIRGFGLDTSETQRVVDIMAKSFSSSALDINKFQTAMATVAPVAKSADVSLERATATLGKLNDAGLDASTSGTGLRNVYLELSKQGLTLNEALDKIENSTDKNKTAMELFGKRGATVGIIMTNTRDEIDELTEALENSNGAAKEMALTMEDNLAGDIDKASSAWEGFILSIESGSGVITQTFRGIVSGLTSMLNMFILANKTAEEIKLEVHLKTLGEQAKADVEEFKAFNEKMEERTGKTQDLTKASERFLQVDIERFIIMKAMGDEDKNQIAILETRIKAIQDFVELSKKSDISLLNSKEELSEKEIKRIRKLNDKINNEFDKQHQKELDDFIEKSENELEDEQEKADFLFEQKSEAKLRELELEEETNKKILDEKEKLNKALLNGTQLASNTLFDVLGNSLKNEETRINQSYDKRQNALKSQLDRGIITQEQYDKSLKDLEKKKAQELYKIELAKFNQKKIQAFSNIAIDIAQAVAKVWAETGLAGIFTQALPIGAGIIQAGIVSSQPAPQPPQFREGGGVRHFTIGGNSHEAGGTTYTGTDGNQFELERGEEAFITKKGNASLQAIAHINELHGGRGLDNVSKYYALGGSVITNTTDSDLIESTVSAVLRNVKIVTQVEDIQIGLDDRNNIINAGVI